MSVGMIRPQNCVDKTKKAYQDRLLKLNNVKRNKKYKSATNEI